MMSLPPCITCFFDQESEADHRERVARANAPYCTEEDCAVCGRVRAEPPPLCLDALFPTVRVPIERAANTPRAVAAHFEEVRGAGGTVVCVTENGWDTQGLQPYDQIHAVCVENTGGPSFPALRGEALGGGSFPPLYAADEETHEYHPAFVVWTPTPEDFDLEPRVSVKLWRVTSVERQPKGTVLARLRKQLAHARKHRLQVILEVVRSSPWAPLWAPQPLEMDRQSIASSNGAKDSTKGSSL